MRTITKFAEENGLKVISGTSIATISKGNIKFRITRQAGNKYKLTISRHGKVLSESTYHSTEQEIINEIVKFLER